MAQASFAQALLRGFLVAVGLGLGFAVSLLTLIPLGDDGELYAFLALFALGALAFFGSALIGGIIGLAAGLRSPGVGQGLGAGFLAGAIGHLVVLVCIFGAFAAYAAATDEPASDEDPLADPAADDESAFAWSDFAKALVFLVPAGVTAAVVAAAVAPAAGATASAPMGAAMPQAAAASAPAPSPYAMAPPLSGSGAPLRRVTCPRCRTPHQVEYVPGQTMTCSSCGFTATLP